MSRQAYYQALGRRQRRQLEDGMILTLLRQLRYHHPRMGLRKAYHQLLPRLRAWGLSVGRDRLLALAREHDLLASSFRRRPRTTQSAHQAGPRRYPDLLAKHPPRRPGQALAADITYVLTRQGHRYLFLVMDVYSRFLLGWHLADSLATSGALRALEEALWRLGELSVPPRERRLQQRQRQPQPQRPSREDEEGGEEELQLRPQLQKQRPPRSGGRPFQGVIHHSDHGAQYASRAYQEFLAREGLRPSMGRLGHAYDNARMERAIGTLKREYGIEGPFPTGGDAAIAVKEAIRLYNHHRPHWALALATPAQVYFGCGKGGGECVNL